MITEIIKASEDSAPIIIETEYSEEREDFARKLTHLPTEEIELVMNAYDIAEPIHSMQKRHSGETAFSHVKGVAEIIIDWGLDGNAISAALLHDTVEDTEDDENPITISDLETLFPNTNIPRLVDGLTLVRSSQRRKLQAETSLKIFSSEDIHVLLIKLADRLNNLRDIDPLLKVKPDSAKAMAH